MVDFIGHPYYLIQNIMKYLKKIIYLFAIFLSFTSIAQTQYYGQNKMNNSENYSQNKILGPYAKQGQASFNNSFMHKQNQRQYVFSNNAPSQLDTSYLYRCVSISTDVVVTDSFYFLGGRTRYCYLSNSLVLPFINKIDLMGNEIWSRVDSLYFRNHYTSYSTNLIKLSSGNLLKVGVFRRLDTLYNDTIENAEIKISYFINTDINGNLLYKKKLNMPVTQGKDLWLLDVKPEKEGGFYGAGYTVSESYHPDPNSQGMYQHDTTFITIFKFDSLANLVDYNRFHIGTEKRAILVSSVEKTADNGYLIGGNTFFANDSDYNAVYNRKYFIIKVDSNLNHQWTKKLGQTKEFLRNKIILSSSKTGGYLFAASYFDDWNPNYPGRMWFGKLSENGDLLWSKKVFKEFDSEIISGTYYPYMLQPPMSIVENDNGDIIIGGQVNFDDGPYIYKTDSSGNELFSRWLMPKRLHSSSNIRNMRQTKDKGFVFVGSQYEINAAGRSAMLIKTDSLGCLLPNCADTLIHLGLEDINKLKEQSLILYPNPAQSTIQIAINKQGEKIEQLFIYDINGREILNEICDEFILTTNISSFSYGVYIIEVRGSKGSILSKKFVKN